MKKPEVVFLRGCLTILRPVERRDIEPLRRMIQDSRVRRFLKRDRPLTELAEEKWYESLADRANDIVFALTTHGGQLLGTMGLHRIEWQHGTAVTGAFIGRPEYWSRGYGTDAKMELLRYAFHELGLRKVTSSVIAYNGRSRAYSIKCGYRIEGRLRKQMFRNGRHCDLILLGVFRPEFERAYRRYRQGRS